MTIGDRLSTTYHRDVTGIPPGLELPRPGLRLRYSRHALNKVNDSFLWKLPDHLPPQFEMIEVTVWGGRVLKWLVRVPWSQIQDLVLVINPTGYVRTLWRNDKDDRHSTLNLARYGRTM